MTDTARADGLDMRFDRIRSGNTFDAHRLVHLGLERGKQGEMEERLFNAYFTEGELVSDHGTLVRLAGEVGLSEAEAATVLSGDTYTREVRADEAMASELGIGGVPFYVFGGKYAVSGAQPPELFFQALTRAWEEAKLPEPLAEGQSAGPTAAEMERAAARFRQRLFSRSDAADPLAGDREAPHLRAAASAASFSLYFLIISSCSCFGTGA